MVRSTGALLSSVGCGRQRARPRSAYQTTLQRPWDVDPQPAREGVGRLCQTAVVAGVVGCARRSRRRAARSGVAASGGDWPGPGPRGLLAHLRVLPPRAAHTAAWPTWAHPDVVDGVRPARLGELWRHQAVAAEARTPGQHVVLSTGTASGKSLAYQLPALTAILERRGGKGERGASTLYISPTKALAQDQLAGVAALGLGVRVTTHDGDSSFDERDWTREHGEYVLTNPDMLHRSLLPRHDRWAGSSARSTWSWSTSATTTAASSAPTSPRCCGGCAGSAPSTGPTRRSCSPRRRSATPPSTPRA